jgi:multidrug efflux pump subunit AcrA (membrane-fusion protein)
LIETRNQREAEYKLQQEEISKAAELERKRKQLEALKKELGETDGN